MINLDFADVRSIMRGMGKAMMGTGEASGDNRAIEAAEKAISNPLLDGVSMKGAKGVIISITGGEDMRLMEVDEAASHIKELVDPDANIIWGSAFNNDLDGRIRVSVVATGIEAEAGVQPQPGKVFAFPRATTTPVATVAPAPTSASKLLGLEPSVFMLRASASAGLSPLPPTAICASAVAGTPARTAPTTAKITDAARRRPDPPFAMRTPMADWSLRKAGCLES